MIGSEINRRVSFSFLQYPNKYSFQNYKLSIILIIPQNLVFLTILFFFFSFKIYVRILFLKLPVTNCFYQAKQLGPKTQVTHHPHITIWPTCHACLTSLCVASLYFRLPRLITTRNNTFSRTFKLLQQVKKCCKSILTTISSPLQNYQKLSVTSTQFLTVTKISTKSIVFTSIHYQ